MPEKMKKFNVEFHFSVQATAEGIYKAQVFALNENHAKTMCLTGFNDIEWELEDLGWEAEKRIVPNDEEDLEVTLVPQSPIQSFIPIDPDEVDSYFDESSKDCDGKPDQVFIVLKDESSAFEHPKIDTLQMNAAEFVKFVEKMNEIKANLESYYDGKPPIITVD
ncbi:MAG: hypothetical protein GYA55_03800 [SAR324 cluster bacterium]|uniref:Uncharacterized protein n=1 Tax=SAR324 cluster bacterium TaxID=2024889 RepID=A0A7X9FQ63_9DELT|nr:hypothetical protein [SAR324 cluster bacterium]